MSPSETPIDFDAIAETIAIDPPECTGQRGPHDDVQPWLLKRDRLTAYSLSQIQKWPAEQWLIHGVVPKGELVLLYGPSRIGKSFILLDIMMCVASGRPFAGIDVEKVPVLYIATEGSSGLPKRVKAWQRENGVVDAPVVVVPGQVDLFSKQGCQSLTSFIQDLEERTGLDFGLIVIDTLAKAMGRAKENDNSDVIVVTLHAQHIAEHFEATVLPVHHTGKSEDAGPRGRLGFHRQRECQYRRELGRRRRADSRTR